MYYFLDVDGVLNKKSDWGKPFSINKEALSNFVSFISEDKDAHIILVSTWRFAIDSDKNPLNKALLRYNITIEDVTPDSVNKSRQEEIVYYIKRHNITEYIVIDDDISLYPYPEEINLYITDYTKGFTKEDIKKINKYIKQIGGTK